MKTGSRQIVLEPAASISMNDLLQMVLSLYPALELHKLLFSINQQYAMGQEMLNDGDEVAIFTAVSGG